MRRLLHGSQVVLLAIAIPVSLAMAFYGVATDDQGFLYSAFAIIMFLIPAMVGLSRRDFDLFEPINIMALSIFFGTTLRSFYLLFASDHPRAQFLMMGQTFEGVNSHIFIVILGIISLCVGYALRIPRIRLERSRFVREYRISRGKLKVVTLLSLIMTFLGLVAFFVDFHVHLSANIGDVLRASQKRAAEYTSSSGETVYGSGWEVFVGQISRFALMVEGAALISKQIRVTFFSILLLVFLFVFSSFIPFLVSDRTPIILSLFGLCVLAYYYRRINIRTAIISLFAVVFVVAGMGSLRAAGRAVEGQSVVDWTIGSGNGFDAVRTTAIIERVPSQHDFKYGSSYLVIPFFFVPRAVWPDKPEVGLGAWVKRDLFHQKWVQNAGWPPSVVGEAWVNFGIVGVLVILPFIGMLFRQVYESCRPLLGRSLSVTTLYSLAAYKLGFNCVETDMSVGLVTTFTQLVPLLVFLWLARSKIPLLAKRVRMSPVHSKPGGPSREIAFQP